MKIIEKAHKFIFKKNILQFTIGIFVFLLIHKPIEIVLTKTVVHYALNYISQIWYNDIVFLIVGLFIIILTTLRFRRYNPSKNLTWLLLLITIIYSFYRMTDLTWDFTEFCLVPNVKYADILIFTSICQLLLLIPANSKQRENGEDSFFDDQPLGNIGFDELGYNSYAELLGKKILSSHFNKSFAIGINGKWGLGKTSFAINSKRIERND